MEEEKDYREVEETTRAAFNYPDRVKRGQIGCPYEHWMVESDIYNDELNRKTVIEFDKDFLLNR